MKILVIGLDCAAPELLLGDDRLSTIRSLMEIGCYGRLERAVPPVVGDGRSIQAPAIWDQVAKEGGKSILIGVPSGGEPAAVEPLISRRPVDVPDLPTGDESRLRDEILEMSRKQFTVVRHALENEPWDYFQFAEVGLAPIQRGFWRYHDPEDVLHEPASPFADVVRDYYLHLDEQLAGVLDSLAEETVVLVVSDRGREHGAFVLASPQLAPIGEVNDANLLDIAPTLLQLGGYAPLPDARGKSLIEGRSPLPTTDAAPLDDDELVRERLRGLGYIG